MENYTDVDEHHFLETRTKAVHFVSYETSNETIQRLASLKTDYMIIGDEHCPTTGRHHLQCYLYTKNKITLSTIHKACLKQCKIFLAKGTAEQNQIYCSKEKIRYVSGILPVGQGKRTDLDTTRANLLAGGTLRDVVLEATSYQSVKMAEQILKYHERKRDWKPIVKWFWGATGTGKSLTAYDELDKDDTYTAMSTGKWWDGYDAHSCVVIDDMRRDFCKFHELLRYLDRYPTIVETKGGTRQFLAKQIIITSCYAPEDMYETREDIQQLLRRIDEVREFTAESLVKINSIN
ncbi:replication associated protein [Lake Sarah-associated circular virus-16]|nr:replication associated protein [Lake Sarah-associated circular virus-16]